MDYSAATIMSMEDRKRARFINSLSGFKSANLIGTVDTQGAENLAIVSSVFHLGASPPLMGFISRPSTVERHTFDNILETGYFSINAVSHEIYEKAHQTSARYSKQESEFELAGLTPYYCGDFLVPFVKESPLNIGLALRQHQTIDLNKTALIIGEITKVMVSEQCVMPDGYIDVEALGLVTVSGLDSYHKTDRLSRLSYAKVDQAVRNLNVEGQDK